MMNLIYTDNNLINTWYKIALFLEIQEIQLGLPPQNGSLEHHQPNIEAQNLFE